MHRGLVIGLMAVCGALWGANEPQEKQGSGDAIAPVVPVNVRGVLYARWVAVMPQWTVPLPYLFDGAADDFGEDDRGCYYDKYMGGCYIYTKNVYLRACTSQGRWRQASMTPDGHVTFAFTPSNRTEYSGCKDWRKRVQSAIREAIDWAAAWACYRGEASGLQECDFFQPLAQMVSCGFLHRRYCERLVAARNVQDHAVVDCYTRSTYPYVDQGDGIRTNEAISPHWVQVANWDTPGTQKLHIVAEGISLVSDIPADREVLRDPNNLCIIYTANKSLARLWVKRAAFEPRPHTQEIDALLNKVEPSKTWGPLRCLTRQLDMGVVDLHELPYMHLSGRFVALQACEQYTSGGLSRVVVDMYGTSETIFER